MISGLAIGAPTTNFSAQGEAAPENAPQLLNVFLDCHLILSCDTDHFRREVTFVNWVRQREDAHVHLILTYTPSGAGNEYQFDNIGLGNFQGEDSHLTWTSSNVNSRDEIIDAITRTMALGSSFPTPNIWALPSNSGLSSTRLTPSRGHGRRETLRPLKVILGTSGCFV